MSGTVVRDAVAAVRAAYDAVAGCDIDLLTATELLDLGDEVETLTRQLPTQSHRLLARLQVETTARELGAKSWRDVLAIRWRLSSKEANRRLAEAAVLGPRRSMTGEPLPPVLPATATAQAHGAITPEHVDIIRTSMGKIPGFVDAATAAAIDVDWARLASRVGPKELLDGVELRLFLLDQDGPEPDDTERARTRGLSIGRQGRNATSQVTGWLTPEARATWEPIFAKYAAPGMCNPADPEPCTSGTPTQAQIDDDHRSLAQRQHDAFLAVGRIALMSGHLGQLNGLPVSIIIRTTLQDLESRAGIGVSGGGTRMPIADVIRLGAHANHHLAVFDKATGSALDLFRARRVASPAQRIMLIAREGGCTKPCCTVGPYGAQVHHAAADWADDGNTNVDEMGLACGADNRMVEKNGGWTTRLNERHEVEWIPPPHLDTGQARINYHHTPERLLTPDDDPQPQPDNNTGDSAPPVPEPKPDANPAPEPFGPWAPDTPAESDGAAPADDDTAEPALPQPDRTPPGASEPFDPWADITSTEPARTPDSAPEPFDPWADVTPTRPESRLLPPQGDSVPPSEPEPFDPWGPATLDEPESASPQPEPLNARAEDARDDLADSGSPPQPDDQDAESPLPEPVRDDGCDPAEPFDPVVDDPGSSDEPGGPEPPDDQVA